MLGERRPENYTGLRKYDAFARDSADFSSSSRIGVVFTFLTGIVSAWLFFSQSVRYLEAGGITSHVNLAQNDISTVRFMLKFYLVEISKLSKVT